MVKKTLFWRVGLLSIGSSVFFVASMPLAAYATAPDYYYERFFGASSEAYVPQTDQSTGALVETIPMVIPPGRNGLQPDVALVYNSQNTAKDGIAGYGWSLSIPHIERINRTGVDNLYTDNYFISS